MEIFSFLLNKTFKKPLQKLAFPASRLFHSGKSFYADEFKTINQISEPLTSLHTQLTRAGCEFADIATGSLIPPINLSTTFERDELLEFSRGFNYSRLGNPTRNLLEDSLANLECGIEGFSFSSGMQAAMSLITACPKYHVLLPDDLYHGVYLMCHEILSPWGLTCEKTDMTNLALLHNRLKDSLNKYKNVLIWLETPSNPLCKVSDIEKISQISKSYVNHQDLNVCVVVDATWSTPFLTRPLLLGADFVLHSTTKYIGGHSDVLGGVIVSGNTKAATTIIDKLRMVHEIGGGVSSPFDSWLTLRGLRTLPIRMQQHSRSAMIIAEELSKHPHVKCVHYPGLTSHPQHKLAKQQMNNMFGGMLSFEVKKNPSLLSTTTTESLSSSSSTSDDDDDNDNVVKESALRVVKRVKLFRRATSLGGTESLIEHRKSVEGPHGCSPPGLLRLSVGLEDPADLIADLIQALE